MTATNNPPPPDPRDYGLDPEWVVASRWERGAAVFTVRSVNYLGTETVDTHDVRWASPPPFRDRRGFFNAIRKALR
jgi:hypothetical protein